jgi:ribose 5-phosphate isomerase B
MKKIALASDHAGFELKNYLLSYLKDTKNYHLEDCGTFDKNSCDYPDFALKVAKLVSEKKIDFGILICGTGIGMSMVANRFSDVRAALCHNLLCAEMSRKHNDANVLCFGARIIEKELAQDIVEIFLNEEFEGGRHLVRINKFKKIF